MTQKLHNRAVTVDGITFPSIREANRYRELSILQRGGKISDLTLQEKYVLIPAQYQIVETGEIYRTGLKRGQKKIKRICIEKECAYYADFSYIENGEKVVEDAKGFRDSSSAAYAKYIIKRKLMLYIHNIRIREV